MPASAEITLTGCAQHNLRDLDLSFPADALIFVTGPSGAGKSSLVFGTLHAESRRRYLESLSTAERSQLDQIAPPQLESAENLPLTVAIRTNSLSTGSRNTVGTESGLLAPLQALFATQSAGFCPACGHPVRTWQPADVLAELDALPAETRLQLGFPFRQNVTAEEASGWLTAAGFRRVALHDRVLTLEELAQQALKSADLTVLVDRVKTGSADSARLRESVETCYRAGQGMCEVFAGGSPVSAGWSACELEGQPWSRRRFTRERDCLHCGRPMRDPVPALFRWTSPLGACPACQGRGLVKSANQSRFPRYNTCPECEGARLNPDARGYRLHGSSFPELHELSVREFGTWIDAHPAEDLQKEELQRRIEVLSSLSMTDLPLSLPAERLSDAERISISLAGAVAEPLPGALYLIEEPFSGRLREEWPAVAEVLNQLRDHGAGVCVVQARADILEEPASFSPVSVFRLGPGSGDRGGRLVDEEEELEAVSELPDREKREGLAEKLIRLRNLCWPRINETEISIAEGGITVLAGPLQSRPIALLRDVLTPLLSGEPSPALESITIDKVLPFDQVHSLTAETRRPHPRQFVAAAVGAFGGIRSAIAETDDAKKRNLTKQDLSLFNKQGARCRRCEGTGRIGVDFDFLPEFELNCPECEGSRYEARVGDVRFRGLTLPEILELTAEEVFRLFKGHHTIQRKLQLLKQVRLGYLRLGQSLTEMSQGERQRLRLAASLAKIRAARTLLVAEELSWGLATSELPSLLSVLREFTTAGHSVLLADAHEFWHQNADHSVRLTPAGIVP